MKKLIILLILMANAVANEKTLIATDFSWLKNIEFFEVDEKKFSELLIKNHPKFKELDLITENTNLQQKINNPFATYNFNSKLEYYNNDGSNNSNNDYESSKITNSISTKNTDGSTTSLNHILNKTGDNYNNNLTLNHTIPLWQNKSGINDKLNYDLSTIDIKINNLSTKQQINKFINDNLKKLINYAFLLNKLDILEQKNRLSKTQLKNIKDKFDENLVDKNEVLLQQINIKNNNLEIIKTKQDIKNILLELQNLLSVKQFIMPKINLNNLISIENINKNLTNIKILKLEQQKLLRELETLKNQDLNQIDLNLNANLNGDDSKVGEAITDNGVSFGLGLEIALPLGDDINQYKIINKYNQIKINKTKITQQQFDNKNNINNLINNIKNQKNIINNIKEQIKLSEENYKEYQKLYANNNKELDFVLNAENTVFNNKLNLLEQLKNYHLLILDYKTTNL